MQIGHAVDRMTAHARQMRHANVTLAAFLYQRKARDSGFVAQKTDAHFIEKACVDLVNDFQVARQHPGEQPHRPPLQRFGQQCVVGVGKSVASDGPGVAPRDAVFVDQQAHQFRNRDRGVSVVQLHGKFFVKALQGDFLQLRDAQHVLQRTGHEEILLLQPQFLALGLLVVGIQHLGDIFRRHLLVYRAVVIAAIEHGKVE